MKKMTKCLFSTAFITTMLLSSSNTFSQESFTIDGDESLIDFIGENSALYMTVQDFTLKNISPEVAEAQVHMLSSCISTIKGTAMWDIQPLKIFSIPLNVKGVSLSEIVISWQTQTASKTILL